MGGSSDPVSYDRVFVNDEQTDKRESALRPEGHRKPVRLYECCGSGGLEALFRHGIEEEPAQSEFFRQFAKLVAWQARRSGLRADDVDEVLQDTAARFWASRKRADPNHVIRFISVIARRATADFLRRSIRQGGKQPSREELPPEPMSSPTLARALEPHFDADAGLRRAGERCRDLIHRIYVDGYTHKEVAEQEGVPLGTILSRSHRCLQKARAYLSQRGYSE